MGDGNIIKTVHERGSGYDRPYTHDEIVLDLKMHQEGQEKALLHLNEEELLMNEENVITPLIKKILQTMKQGEEISAVVKSEYAMKIDPDFASRYPLFNPEKPLVLDMNLKALARVRDLYRNQSVFVKTITLGEGSASPYFDCFVTLRVRIDVDGENKLDQFKIGVVAEANTEIIGGMSSEYDLEHYTVPAVVRKVLKFTKPLEVVQIRVKKEG